MITFTKHQKQDGNPKKHVSNNLDFINKHPDITTGNEHHVATILCQFAGKDGKCFPSLAAICKRTRLSKTAVKTALRKLQEKQIIEILHDVRPNGSSRSNTYVILAPGNKGTTDRLKINFHNRGAYTYDQSSGFATQSSLKTIDTGLEKKDTGLETIPFKHKENHQDNLHVHADVISIKRYGGYSPGSTHDAHAERTPGKKDSCHIEPEEFKKTDAATMDHYRGEFITAGLITDSQDDKNRFYSVWLTTSRNWKSGKVRSPGAYFRKAIATGEIYITQSIDDAAAQLIKGKSTPQSIRTSDNRDPSSGGGTRTPAASQVGDEGLEPPQSSSNRGRTCKEYEKEFKYWEGECCRLKGKPGYEEAIRQRDEAERRYLEEAYGSHPQTATERAKAA